MDRKKIVIVTLLILVLIGIFSFYFYNQKIVRNFDVVYYSKSSSSGGDRILNITYTINDGVITSCKGDYFFSGTDGVKTESCNLTKLRNQEYPFVLEKLITKYSKGEKISDEVNGGSFYYHWQIILNS